MADRDPGKVSSQVNWREVARLVLTSREMDRIEEEVKGISDQLSGEKKRLELLESQLRQLEAIADIKVEVGALRK